MRRGRRGEKGRGWGEVPHTNTHRNTYNQAFQITSSKYNRKYPLRTPTDINNDHATIYWSYPQPLNKLMHTSYTEDKEMCEDLKWSHEAKYTVVNMHYSVLISEQPEV